jgi:hypothetical protein
VAASDSKHFRAVVGGPYYLSAQFLSKKSLRAMRSRQRKSKNHAAKIIARWKKRFCSPDHLNDGWLCYWLMDRLTVADMEQMLRDGIKRR